MVNLKSLRIAKGMTQEQLASAANVARTVIANIENGFANPSVATAKALGSILEIEWWRFFDEGAPT